MSWRLEIEIFCRLMSGGVSRQRWHVVWNPQQGPQSPRGHAMSTRALGRHRPLPAVIGPGCLADGMTGGPNSFDFHTPRSCHGSSSRPAFRLRYTSVFEEQICQRLLKILCRSMGCRPR